jgi:hypothetical protein
MATTWTGITEANGTSWTDLPKAVSNTSVVSFVYDGGEPIGLLLALTRSSLLGTASVVTSKWSSVISNATSWTDVSKAT